MFGGNAAWLVALMSAGPVSLVEPTRFDLGSPADPVQLEVWVENSSTARLTVEALRLEPWSKGLEGDKHFAVDDAPALEGFGSQSIPPGAVAPLKLTLRGLPATGRLRAGLRGRAGGKTYALGAIELFTRRPWWLCALLLTAGLTSSAALRRYAREGRERLERRRSFAELAEAFDAGAGRLTGLKPALLEDHRQALRRGTSDGSKDGLVRARAAQALLFSLAGAQRARELLNPGAPKDKLAGAIQDAEQALRDQQDDLEKRRITLEQVSSAEVLVADLSDRRDKYRQWIAALRRDFGEHASLQSAEDTLARLDPGDPAAAREQLAQLDGPLARAEAWSTGQSLRALLDKLVTDQELQALVAEWSELTDALAALPPGQARRELDRRGRGLWEQAFEAAAQLLPRLREKTAGLVKPEPARAALDTLAGQLEAAQRAVRAGERRGVEALEPLARALRNQARDLGLLPATVSAARAPTTPAGPPVGEAVLPRPVTLQVSAVALAVELRWRDWAFTGVTLALALASGLRVLWLESLSWGGANDLLIALLWGFGVHQLSAIPFDSLEALKARLLKPAG